MTRTERQSRNDSIRAMRASGHTYLECSEAHATTTTLARRVSGDVYVANPPKPGRRIGFKSRVADERADLARRLRATHGMTVEAIAERMNVSTTLVKGYLAGEEHREILRQRSRNYRAQKAAERITGGA